LLDRDGNPIRPGCRGLLELHAIEAPETPVVLPELLVLADVRTPLLGDGGAARVFGPQKGAGQGDVPVLDRGLERWAEVVLRELDRDVAKLPGSGAAGGLGAAFDAFLNAPPQSGADWVLETVGFDALLGEADVVVTGEGTWDEQSMMGKATGAVVTRAVAAGVPVLVVAGAVEASAPEGVVVVDGDGGPLDADGIRARVAEALPGLLARRDDR
ncbi:MAG: glycerate kinase, partial [Gemmatimonadota bacterium]